MSTSSRPEPLDPVEPPSRPSTHRPDGLAPATQDPAEPDTAVPAGRSRGRLVAWTVGLAVLVLLLDQLTKWWAESTLELGDDPVRLVGSLLGLRLLYNPGAALSIATGMTWLLTIVVVAVVVVIVRMVGRIGSRGWAIALGLLLGGAVGNLVDRIFREPGFARGHVVDFIDYAGFFVGNVADIAIVAAAVMIVVLSLLGIGLDGTRQGRDGEDSTDAVGTTSAEDGPRGADATEGESR
jgi:signal peptidase II